MPKDIAALLKQLAQTMKRFAGKEIELFRLLLQ